MTYAKAQLDHARQKEKDCFEDFGEAHDHAVVITSRLVGANNSSGSRSTDEPDDDTDVSTLGPRRVRTKTTRAPTIATAGPSRLVTKPAPTRAAVTASARGPPGPIPSALAKRASDSTPFRALMKIVATGNANQRQLLAFQEAINEATVTLNSNNAQAASLECIKQESTSDS
jgi:hypothetical protein